VNDKKEKPMLKFREWNTITEGGNVMIGDVAANRIELQNINRQEVVKEIGIGLKAISKKFEAVHGLPLWNDELLASKEYLSGSSLHLFDLRGISDEDFLKHKPTVGDIDTQVDGNMKGMIDSFLKGMTPGLKLGPLIYVGSKPSGDQFITLWTVPKFGINVQIDLELVDFENGKPTPWSSFSHSSAWDDLKLGIKGVFQKYLLRAFQARTAKDVLIQPKTARGKEKIIRKSELAFSLKGLRVRMEPVLNDKGEQIFKNGMPVYIELDSSGADYITDLDVLFASFFGVKGVKAEVESMASFAGLVALMAKYMTKSDQKLVLDGFANVMFEKGAQGLVRGDPQADYKTKILAFKYITDRLKVGEIEDYRPLIDAYYKSYK
jgi:hypothetical protein